MTDSLGIAALGAPATSRRAPASGRPTGLTFKHALARAGQFSVAKARQAQLHHRAAGIAPALGTTGIMQSSVTAGAVAAGAAAASAAAGGESAVPANADAALSAAMQRENVPESWRPGLRFIMQKESGGQVDARNPIHSARGLFQLTRANYHLNPNGAASFGNGVEEAQGGIRYIKTRYGTPDRAVAHWQTHHWY